MVAELKAGHAQLVERVAEALAADFDNEVAFMAGDNKAGFEALARAAIRAIITERPHLPEQPLPR